MSYPKSYNERIYLTPCIIYRLVWNVDTQAILQPIVTAVLKLFQETKPMNRRNSLIYI